MLHEKYCAERQPDGQADWERIRGRIGLKLIGPEAGAALPAEVPHRHILDLTLVYYVYRERQGIPLGCEAVSGRDLMVWGIGEEELHRQARENAENFFAPEVKRVTDMIASLLLCEEKAQEAEKGDPDPFPLYVVTNRLRFFGASCALLPGVLQELARSQGWEDCYVIPSSVHEMLLLPCWAGDAEGLREIIRDINDHAVEPEERLSYSVYHYRLAGDEIELEGSNRRMPVDI